MSKQTPAHPEPVEGPAPGIPRDLPDFLKWRPAPAEAGGDPALTWPHGKTYGVNHPKGVPNLPGPITRDELTRDWLAHVAAGRIGSNSA